MGTNLTRDREKKRACCVSEMTIVQEKSFFDYSNDFCI
ncbi:hypothetical protein O53_1570 [Microcystis aeruginosa TAIHU98]|uniref:Uncharacterized protein n=1 Tax=Microcystis aeruginosa TAIHU98 TaxID=1134457 RepID=L7EE08_MICAE|nr:hypothetical protein O53_1570 [Microcystis aeruginosa TAIHU98]ODV38441.1 hypothetical protein BFG60_2047 [Microcystis aeruginosa NIES-98]